MNRFGVAMLFCWAGLACASTGDPNRQGHPVGSPTDAAGNAGSATPSPIADENERLGTLLADLDKPATQHEVEGYTSVISASAGQTVQLFVNVDHDQPVRWDLYRVGYYQGLGARLVASGGPQAVSAQPDCPVDPKTGLVACAWASAFDITVDPEWVSGYYFFQLVNDDGFQARVPLIVLEAGRRASALVQASVGTWQAYNNWGGTSLYENLVANAGGFSGKRASHVSFDRPYANPTVWATEWTMVQWLEKQDYDVAYATNVDIDADASLLDQRKLFVSVAHDEYWSVPERDAVERARDAGVSLAFFSANTGYWRVRFEPSSSGDRRVMVCYKKANMDPQSHSPETTVEFRGQPNPRPEDSLIGIMYSEGGWTDMDGFPFVVKNAQHWVYAGTHVQELETLSHVVGYEWDAMQNDAASPPGLEVVSESPTVTSRGKPGVSNAAVYYPTSSSFVFAAGTIYWSRGLGQPGYIDTRIQRITQNVFARAGLLSGRPSRDPKPPPTQSGSAQLSRVIAGTGAPGNADGPALSAQFAAPAGVAAGPHGELYVADTGNNSLRKISPDGLVSTLASCSGAKADDCLDTPIGIAVDASGTVYVSDSQHARIRSFGTDGAVLTFAGSGTAGILDGSDRLAAQFSEPRGLAVGAAGELYVADYGNDAIRRIDAEGVTTVATGITQPSAVAVGSDGALYFVSTGTAQIGVVRNGTVQMLANRGAMLGDRGGPGTHARLRPMDGLVFDDLGLVLSDTANYRVRRLELEAERVHFVSTLLGDGKAGTETPGGAAARVVLPRGLTSFQGGYAVADSGNHRILWFREVNVESGLVAGTSSP